MRHGSGRPPANEPSRGLRAGAWVTYDLANTIYAASITYLFTPYFTERFEARTGIGVCTTASMLVAGLLSPWIGALCDRTGRARTYLTLATIANVACMLLWGLGGSALALLAILFVANVAYQTALTFYNALLPSVAAPGREGWLSGLGTGVGYFGNVVVLLALIVVPPASFAEAPGHLAFGGLAFLLFAGPCLLLVRDTRPIEPAPLGPALRASLRSLGSTLQSLPQHRALAWFLLGNFCVVDVLNTAIQFFGDFVKEVYRKPFASGALSWFGMPFGPQAGSMVMFLGMLGLCFSALAFGFGLVLGSVTDRRPLAVMLGSVVALGLALGGGAWFGGGDTTWFTITLVGGGAFGMAGIWTAGRKLLLQLAPPDRVGEYFGLYGITVKVSVLGSTLYGMLADAFGSVPALLAQLAPLLLGLACLAMVRMPTQTPAQRP
ncbi:MAG: MFS transporter [Planctomycetota bacterium]